MSKTKVIKRDPETGIRLQTWNKADSGIQPITPNDSMQTVLEMAIETIERERNGNAAVYPNTAEGLQMFQARTQEYFRRIRDHNTALDAETRAMLPDIEGWALYCGVSRVTLFSYSRRGGEWERFIELVKDGIAAAKKAAANDFRTPPVFTIFDLKCNHGYIEKSELMLTTNADLEERQLQDAIDAHGLRWNEERGEYEPIEEGASYDT